jgi:hypothetical protein
MTSGLEDNPRGFTDRRLVVGNEDTHGRELFEKAQGQDRKRGHEGI